MKDAVDGSSLIRRARERERTETQPAEAGYVGLKLWKADYADEVEKEDVGGAKPSTRGAIPAQGKEQRGKAKISDTVMAEG